MTYDFLVVGAGFAGATLAERLASQLRASVLVVDRRDHVGGNCYDPIGDDGLRRHVYGPHIFHTNSAEVMSYLSGFTGWRPYAHRVLARVRGQLVPVPINRTTINALYGLSLDSAGIEQFLANRAVPTERITNSEEAILSKVGTELYQLFFQGYTRKHWGLDPSRLDAAVCGRIPTRFNDDDRYFTDVHQAMPDPGYAELFANMLRSPHIETVLGVSYRDVVDRVRFRHLVFTGPLDEYFGYRFGPLPYRSLQFEFETVDVARGLPVGCVNEPDEAVAHTRTTDYRFLTGQRLDRTVLSREYPSAAGDPYYPVPNAENRELLRKYSALASLEPYVTFAGRLAEYRYYNMDQVVASALAKFKQMAQAAA